MKYYLLLFGLLFSLNLQFAQTLFPGDITIIGVNSDNPDDFSFVTLIDLPTGTEIRFTDSGVFSDGTFRANEGAIKYTAPTFIVAGTIITYSVNSANFVSDNDANIGTNGFSLSTAGDQIIAFQGLSTSPNFIYAVQSNSNNWQTTATESYNSALPPNLINGLTAVAVGSGSGDGDEFDNAVFNMSITSGTKVELLQVISNNSNWNKSNNPILMPTGAFTVSGGTVTIPDAPLATEATNITNESFTANWNASTGATKYYLDVSELSDFSTFVTGFNNLDVGNNTSYSVTGLTATSDYYLRVRANNSAGTSVNSNSILATTIVIPPTTVYFNTASASALETGGYL